ncbi:MAG: HD domain-containing protein [Deltaproteobacteria bacterium]|nr:HD domain-containing protein [Deltaproteobacteria bacterium]
MSLPTPKGFIPVNPGDIKANEPLPYPIFDEDGRLLLEKDSIPISEFQVAKLKQGFTANIQTDFGKHVIEGIKKKTEESAMDPLSMLEDVKNTINRVLNSKSKDIDILQDITIATSRLINNLSRFSHSWLLLARCEEFSNYYEYLALKIAVYSMLIGKNIFPQREGLVKLTIAALLHDIGHSIIPPSILHKTSALTNEEWDIIKKHPSHSTKILLDLGIRDEKIVNGILYHHEKLTGNGYFGKKGDEVPIESQIITVATAYNAMISDRPHKTAIEPRDALKYLWEDADKAYKKICAEYLIKEVGVYPVGSIVRLSTEEIGMVVKANKINPMKPLVWLLLDKKGQKLFSKTMRDTSRSDTFTGEIKVVSIIPSSSLGFSPNISNFVLTSKMLF